MMNGTEWPSPALNLPKIEEHINKILASTGVDPPSLTPGFLFTSVDLYKCFKAYNH